MDTPEPRLQLEPMTLETVEAVEALERECFSSPWSLDSLVEELSNPLSVFYIARSAEGVVGYVGMHHILDEGYLTNLAVTASFRRQGVARALLDQVLAYGEEHELQMVTLEVRASNEPAIALYKRFDFEQEGRRKSYYQDPVEDALIMTRKL